MKESDSFSLCPNARNVVDQPQPGHPAFLESTLEVVNREADVVNTRTSLRDEFPDRGVVAGRLEQLDERLTGGHCGDVSAVGISYLRHLHPQDLGEERHARSDRF